VLDEEIVGWIRKYKDATAEEFEEFLRLRYQDEALLKRFPNGL
jgi:hypothetical protein